MKTYTSKTREKLGLPTGKIEIKNGGGRDYIRELVRMRDGHMCKKCGLRWVAGTRRLDVHHKDPKMEGMSHTKGVVRKDKKNLSQMITLCHKCHLGLHQVKKKMSVAKRSKRLTEGRRKDILILCRKGWRQVDVARMYKVTPQTINKYVRRYEKEIISKIVVGNRHKTSIKRLKIKGFHCPQLYA